MKGLNYWLNYGQVFSIWGSSYMPRFKNLRVSNKKGVRQKAIFRFLHLDFISFINLVSFHTLKITWKSGWLNALKILVRVFCLFDIWRQIPRIKISSSGYHFSSIIELKEKKLRPASRLILKKWAQEPRYKGASPKGSLLWAYIEKISEWITKNCGFPFFPGGRLTRKKNDGGNMKFGFMFAFLFEALINFMCYKC